MSSKMFFGCLFLLVVLIAHASACGRRDNGDDKPAVDDKPSTGSESSNSSGTTINACCQCGQPMSLSMIVSNQIQEPFFEFRTEIKNIRQRELIHQLEAASLQSKNFRFSVQHYGSLGYLITTLNSLAGSTENKTYWQITSQPNGLNSFRSLPLGVSLYIPTHNEVVMFNFTSWANH